VHRSRENRFEAVPELPETDFDLSVVVADDVPWAAPPARRDSGPPPSAVTAPRWAALFWVLADFVCSVQPGAADGVAFDGGDHVIEGEAGWQAGGLVEGEELENVGVGPV
jgi:hypothetical protein